MKEFLAYVLAYGLLAVVAADLGWQLKDFSIPEESFYCRTFGCNSTGSVSPVDSFYGKNFTVPVGTPAVFYNEDERLYGPQPFRR